MHLPEWRSNWHPTIFPPLILLTHQTHRLSISTMKGKLSCGLCSRHEFGKSHQIVAAESRSSSRKMQQGKSWVPSRIVLQWRYHIFVVGRESKARARRSWVVGHDSWTLGHGSQHLFVPRPRCPREHIYSSSREAWFFSLSSPGTWGWSRKRKIFFFSLSLSL